MLFNNKKINKQRGQGLLEYALILFISIIAASYIRSTQVSVEDYIRLGFGDRNKSQNPAIAELKLPDKVDHTTAWGGGGSGSSNGNPLSPVAFFSAPNPAYTGTNIAYWDGSYDPDGVIVQRKWYVNGTETSYPPTNFANEGTITIMLEVTDNDDNKDTYTMVLEIKKRENYRRLVYDHKNETRVLISEGPPYNVGSATTKIIEHVFGKRNDLYKKPHVVIEENYVQTTQERARVNYYEVTVPVIEVTYDANGNTINSKPYIDPSTGRQMVVVQTDDEIVVMPAEIRNVTQKNNWTFYVYNKISSVQNATGGFGSRSPSNDYTRFYPEKEETTQFPSFVSSRDSEKSNSYNPGYNAKTSPCPTCTEPNRFSRQTVRETQMNTVTRDGFMWGITTHDRNHNYIDHQAYDWIYKYTGTGYSTGNAPNGTLEKLLRSTWRTEGWESSEQIGGSESNPETLRSDVISRDKYTECSGGGWSESCWNELSNTTYGSKSWYYLRQTTKTETSSSINWEESGWNEETGEYEIIYSNYERTCTYNVYERENWSYNWLGTSFVSSSYSLEEKEEFSSCGEWVVVPD